MIEPFQLEIVAQPLVHIERPTPPPVAPAPIVAGGMAWLRVGKKRLWVSVKDVSPCRRYARVFVNTRERWVKAAELETPKR